jgi:hypothetical protein
MSFIRCCKRARRCRNFCSSGAAQIFRVAFVMDGKLFAGVNVILRISSLELNGRLTIKSAGHALHLMSGFGVNQDFPA